MKTTVSPLVSVVTPVYNGAEYLTRCIESVLAQTYANWEYTIVDNFSADESLAIARKCAVGDSRIRVLSTGASLRKVESHNHASRQISPESKYCKFLYADDFLYPSCIEEMVRRAEQRPSVGLVGAYTTDGQAVIWSGPKDSSECVPGREVCRSILLGGPYILGSMTSLLVRSDLVRGRADFFDETNPYREMDACFSVLKESDYGYIHQILSYRRPPQQLADKLQRDSSILGQLRILMKFGPAFLNDSEYGREWKKVWRAYHRVLARSVLRRRPREYWKYHEETLAAFNCQIDRRLLVASVVVEVARYLSSPVQNVKKGLAWWSRANQGSPRKN